jgi:hypothetical protein
MKLKEVGQINNFICFDLEGLLSPQDNAYDLIEAHTRRGGLAV